jgi:hypothetical protein
MVNSKRQHLLVKNLDRNTVANPATFSSENCIAAESNKVDKLETTHYSLTLAIINSGVDQNHSKTIVRRCACAEVFRNASPRGSNP